MNLKNASRRDVLRQGSIWLLLGSAELACGASIMAVRVWPAKDYTRVTLESDTALKYNQQFVSNPPRLAVDIDGIDLQPTLRELVAKVKTDDPYIAGIRVGQNAPGKVRLVLDLKQAAAPQVFTLPPAAAYGHRLVFDLYPAKQVDPLESLIAEIANSPAQSATANNTSTRPNRPASAPSPSHDPLGDWIHKQANATGPGTGAGGDKAIGSPPTKTTNSVANSSIPTGATSGKYQGTPGTTGGQDSSGNSPTHGGTDRLIIIALDPGHGGEDPGAIGPAGTREKDVVLQVALKLRERINNQTISLRGGRAMMRAYLTRDADFFVPLHVRVQKARGVQADLFISIHADAFFTPQAKGASVFALSASGASSSAARWLANKENRSDLVGGVNIKTTDRQTQAALLDMSTTAQINDSLKLGSLVLGEMGGVGKLHKARVEQAGFAVLKAPDIPSVLVETAFISNPEEEQRLASDDYQEQLADALMRGINGYFAKNPPLARSRAV